MGWVAGGIDTTVSCSWVYYNKAKEEIKRQLKEDGDGGKLIATMHSLKPYMSSKNTLSLAVPLLSWSVKSSRNPPIRLNPQTFDLDRILVWAGESKGIKLILASRSIPASIYEALSHSIDRFCMGNLTHKTVARPVPVNVLRECQVSLSSSIWTGVRITNLIS